ncbi:MAG: type III pantothenate kinase [Nitrosomonas sp.]|nr:type III pantothenate kinase [Nitrosomonas sp.]
MLAVDSGNTLIKWGLHNGTNWLETGKVQHCDISLLEDSWCNLPKPTLIVASNVAGSDVKDTLSGLFKQWSIKPFWVQSSSYLCGIRNLYSEPDQLGSDRWAALIAAWGLFNQSCLVVNVGTAMTVDMLSDSGVFLGGIITPGPGLLFRVLESNTAISNIQSGNFNESPLCTENAIFTGVIHSLVGAVERMFGLFCDNADCTVHRCIVSGGSSSLLLPYMDFAVNIVDNLVLEGLIIIAKEHIS